MRQRGAVRNLELSQSSTTFLYHSSLRCSAVLQNVGVLRLKLFAASDPLRRAALVMAAYGLNSDQIASKQRTFASEKR